MRVEALDPSLALEAQDIWAGYNGWPALEGVTFNIETGCLGGLVGPNGSGKSTLLKVMLGLHRPWRGEVLTYGRPGRPENVRVGYMPQSELVDWAFPLTVAQVVLMGRYGRIGLLQAQEILKAIEGIKFIYFTGADVVRHSLVQKIIEA